MTDPVVPPQPGGTFPPPGAPSFPPPNAGYPAQGHSGQGYPQQGYPAQGAPGQGYPGQGAPGQGYQAHGAPGQGYQPQGHPGPGQPAQGYPAQGAPGQGYPPAYAGGQFPPQNAGGPPPQAGGAFPVAPFPGTPEGKPKKKFFAKALGILGTLVVIAIIAVIKLGVGSALAEDPTADAKAGDCIGVKSEMSEAATEVDAKIVECSSADAKYTVLGRAEGVKDVQTTACDATFDEKLKEGEEGFVIASQEGKGYALCLKANA